MTSVSVEKRACRATTRAGKPCRTHPLHGEDYCAAHHPDPPDYVGFRPGMSNPGSGRPPKPTVTGLLLEKAVAQRETIWSVFEDCLQSDDPAIRLKAADTLLSWLYSKPKQQTELTGADGGPLALTLVDLMRERAQLRAAS